MQKKALFVHGFNSGSDSSTGAQVKKYLEEGHYDGKKYAVDVLDFDMINPSETIGRIWKASKSQEYNLIVGHSLGGFYVLASQFDIQKLVINPCMFPSVEIPKLDENHVVTPALLEKWKKLESEIYCQIDPETKDLIAGVFGESDPLFSYYEKFQSIYGKERAVKVPGEHKFTDEQIKAALDAGFYDTKPLPGSCAPMSFEGSDEYDDEAFIKALQKKP